MPVKITLEFSQATLPNADSPRARVADWTESYWAGSDDIDTAFALARNGAVAGGEGILQARAALLPAAGAIVGVTGLRYTVPVGSGPELASGGVAEMQDARFVGNPILIQRDAPQMALMFSMGFTGHNKTIHPKLRGTPDNMVVSGEATFRELNYRLLVASFLDRLARGFGAVIDNRVAGPAFAGFLLNGVLANGQVQGVRPVTGIAVDDWVKVIRTTKADKTIVSGPFVVQSIGVGGEPILAGWNAGLTKGGRIFKWRRSFATFLRNEMVFQRAITYKVGSKRSYRGANHRTKRP